MNQWTGGGGVEVDVTRVKIGDSCAFFSGGTGAAVGYLPHVMGERVGRRPLRAVKLVAGDVVVSCVAVPEVLQLGRHCGESGQNTAHGKLATVFGDNGFGQIHQPAAFGVGWHSIQD